jgi:GNAT superfamily N-acetyltransferase
MEAI